MTMPDAPVAGDPGDAPGPPTVADQVVAVALAIVAIVMCGFALLLFALSGVDF